MDYKISVIIPVFNNEITIKKALDSVIAQTIGFEQLEVIMVDDCSTDSSCTIIDDYAAKYENFTVTHLPNNSKGPSRPRNVGLEIATSDYLMFLDSDDLYSTDACKLLYDKITTEDADVVFGTFTKLDEISKQRSIVRPFKMEEGKTEIKAETIDDEKRFLSFAPSLWARIFRRKFIKQNNIRFPEGIHGPEDMVFVIHALLKAKGIIFIDDVIVHYNNFRQGAITDFTDKENFIGLLYGYYQTYDICKENGRKGDFISYIIQEHLIYMIKNLISLDSNDLEKKEVLNFSYPLFKLCENHLTVPEYFKPVFTSIVNKDFDNTILLLDQLFYFKKIENQLRRKIYQSRKQLKTSRNSVKKIKNEYKDFKSEHENLKSQFYELQYKNNVGRPAVQRIISLFPWLYLLLKMRKNSFKNRVLNIKGYYSIKKNNLLDIGFYLKNNSDVRLSGMDPVIHYMLYGYNEGRNPNPTFNGEDYFKTHMEISKQGLSPLVHYSLFGIE